MTPLHIAGFLVEDQLHNDRLGARLIAHDSASGERVLLRILDPPLLADPAFRATVRSAPERLRAFRHSNAALYIGGGEFEGRAYLIMPYCPGATLAEVLTQDPAFWPAERGLAVLGQLASALDAAHAQGLCHGYLAPPQIILSAHDHVTITDFGLAWPGEISSGPLLSVADPILALTTAPEVVAGGSPAASSDRYALAVLAYRLLTGQWPFTGTTAAEILQGHLARQPADPRSVNPELSRAQADVLLCGLAKDPAQRYATGAEFVAALSAAACRPWQRIGLSFAAVPAGLFTFGQGARARILTLPAFEMGVYPVTVAQFAAFVEDIRYVTQAEREGWGLAFTGGRWREVSGACWRAPRGPGSGVQGRENHPVVQVSYADAAAFCAWADVTLPDERQWEKAARGADGRFYPWGDRWRPELCNYADSGLRDTAPVDGYPGDASPYGVRGLAGNVWEWTTSLYSEAGEYRVLRGGAWPHDGRYLTATFRYYALPGYRSDALGFRCVRTG